MSNLIEHKEAGKRNPTFWEIVQDNALHIAGYVAVLVLIYMFVRATVIPFGYDFFVGLMSSDFGLENVYARPLAIALTAFAVAATPSLLLAIFFGYRAWSVFAAILGVSVMFAVATFFFTSDVYFDRVTGKSQKCYAKTLEGFKFSSTCDFDPKLGVRFQKIDSDVMKEIVFWQRNGALKDIPPVNDGQYFDPLTGESIVWYSLNSNGSIQLFSLPGFDPATGKRLKPITQKIIDEYAPNAGNGARISNRYKSKTLLADINQAFLVGSGQYGSTEDSRLAMGRIWKWYFAQDNLPKVRSPSLEVENYSVNVQVEKVFEIEPYAFVVVAFSTDSSDGHIYCISSVRDKDAHSINSTFRPELAGFRYEGDAWRSEHTVNLSLNPHEAIRVMFVVKITAPGQMNAGYVQCNSGKAVEYTLEG